MPRPDQPGPTPAAGRFASTHWSVVLQAQGSSSQAQEALATLCQSYWYPLYTFIRREVGSADQAEDLTQEFFARLLENGAIRQAAPARGKLRTFLLACCQHFLANERDRARAQKRGGGRAPLQLDFAAAERRYLQEPAHTLTAQRLYERRWALALLDQTLQLLEEEYHAVGKGPLYDQLKHHLVGGPDGASYAEAAGRLGLSEDAVKKAAQRLRQRYRALVREQILATVEGPGQVEDEVRDLFTVLGG